MDRRDAGRDGSEETGRDASEETVAEVDHEHPTTGETFDRTGVHGRGREHPDAVVDEDAEDDLAEDVDEETTEDVDDEVTADTDDAVGP